MKKETFLTFYCGRPRDERLSCAHITASSNLYTTMNLRQGATAAERDLMKTVVTEIANRRIQRDLFLVTVQNKGSVQLKPCKSLGPRITWSTQQPTGFLTSAGTWQSLQCQTSPLTTPQISRCFQNTNFWLFGDSNAIRLKAAILRLLNPPASCTGDQGKWVVNTTCTRPNLNFTLTFDPHEYHLHLGANFWPVYKGKGVAGHIDSIPRSGRYVVIVHYFLHTQSAHLAVVHRRLLKYKDAVQRAVVRNPNITFAFRGPHVSSKQWPTNHSSGGDTLIVFYLQLIKDVFKDVMDHVVFLDGWGISVAIENQYFHPPAEVPTAMVRLLLSYVCR